MKIKVILAGMLALSNAFALQAKPTLVKTTMDVEEYQLNNGLKIILAPNLHAHKVAMSMVYLTGSLNDPQGKSGLAHLLEHLAFKGTQEVQGEKFDEQLNQYTLMHNAATNYYSTTYINDIRPIQQDINHVLYLESQRMNRLVLQKKYVPSELQIVRREREASIEQPVSVLTNQVFSEVYGNQFLGRLPIGDLEELKSIQLPELKQYYETWYAPNNAVLVLTGNFDKTQTLNAIEQQFEPIKAKKLPKLNVKLTPKAPEKRHFAIQQGSDFLHLNFYLTEKNDDLHTALLLVPYLYDFEPSGLLYKKLVKKGLVTTTLSNAWFEADFNFLMLGAIYSAQQKTSTVAQSLNNELKEANFTQQDLVRAKNLAKNDMNSVVNDETILNQMLSDYFVTNHGQWDDYFKDQDKLQQATPTILNAQLNQLIQPQNLFEGDISPTDTTKKIQNTAEEKLLADEDSAPVEPILDEKTYQKQTIDSLVKVREKFLEENKKIQKGALNNGMKYTLYTTETPDNKVYATINMHFGTAETLKNKRAILGLMNYLLLRGSKNQDLQEITDKGISADGQAITTLNNNQMTLQIQANKDSFTSYFMYVIQLLQTADFNQDEFNLAKQRIMSSLDRPYTEPDVISSLALSRETEQYPMGDIRYHFEPKLEIEQNKKVNVGDVKKLYRNFFNLNKAEMVITGQVNQQAILNPLNTILIKKEKLATYAPISERYQPLKASYSHIKSEPKEFGVYRGILTLPVNAYDEDVPALDVLASILGESQLTSRLGKALREKNHLVYGYQFQADFDLYQHAGQFQIMANYLPTHADDVSRVVHEVIKSLNEQGVTQQEVTAAKATILKQHATYVEDSRIVHQLLAVASKTNQSVDDEIKRNEKIASLTKDDIDKVIKKYLNIERYVEVSADQFGK